MPTPAIQPARPPVQPPLQPTHLSLPPVDPTLTVVTIDGNAPTWVESPARVLHDRLVQSLALSRTDDLPLYSPRVRAAILVGSVVGLWAIILGVAAALL